MKMQCFTLFYPISLLILFPAFKMGPLEGLHICARCVGCSYTYNNIYIYNIIISIILITSIYLIFQRISIIYIYNHTIHIYIIIYRKIQNHQHKNPFCHPGAQLSHWLSGSHRSLWASLEFAHPHHRRCEKTRGAVPP